jgi:hypothetical protein
MIEDFIDLVYVSINQMIIDDLTNINQKQIYSVSRRFKNRIIILSIKRLRDNNL